MAEYATLGELKALRRITGTADDVPLQRVLVAASRAIDRKTGRDADGFVADPAASPRVFRTAGRAVADRDGELLLVDEVANLLDLTVEIGDDGTTWTPVTDFRPEPTTAPTSGRPVTGLRRVRGCWTTDLVRVTARWGWPAVPDEIVEATLLLANRLYLRKDSPEGVAGSAEWGVLRLSRWDPDVETLVGPYVLPGVA